MTNSKNLAVNIAGVSLKNPIITASGTFNSGMEYSQLFDVSRLGAITAKGVSHDPWEGNPPPRTAETHSGMLNAVGLQNPGAQAFIEKDLPFLRQLDTKVIINLCGKTEDEYIAVTQDFASTTGVDLYELNISCPNIKAGGMAMGTDPKMTERITRKIKDIANAPVIVKLSPNVTNIAEIALAAEAGGADGVSLINTVLGMKIDIHRRRPILGNKLGGLSGPAIKPIAVRMVYQVAQAVNIPIIGMGGITTADDAIEFIMAGATAVAVGMASFSNPHATLDIINGIERYMERYSVSDINDLRGVVS